MSEARALAEVVDPEDMHLAGLILGRLLGAAERASPGRRLPGSVAVDADGMRVTVIPRPEGHVVRRGLVAPLAASVRAPLPTLIALAGGGGEVRAFLFGGLRAWGDPRALWAFRALLRAARRTP